MRIKNLTVLLITLSLLLTACGSHYNDVSLEKESQSSVESYSESDEQQSCNVSNSVVSDTIVNDDVSKYFNTSDGHKDTFTLGNTTVNYLPGMEYNSDGIVIKDSDGDVTLRAVATDQTSEVLDLSSIDALVESQHIGVDGYQNSDKKLLYTKDLGNTYLVVDSVPGMFIGSEYRLFNKNSTDLEFVYTVTVYNCPASLSDDGYNNFKSIMDTISSDTSKIDITKDEYLGTLSKAVDAVNDVSDASTVSE